ncbi:hypothetical protein CNYM01_04311 [Colletotrichum nymphaeae SA-01]|uniref:BTB domain-containing protein n=1 Tax=Colletotrichum nymphaeae SA-01 TaxID=1460502 RepID=A0A135UK57_9PEZI|nr:hypothetical protein CNYM01_04311 [Colletotrichum nymphaeae SA-01]
MHNEPEAMMDRDGEVLFPISSGDDDDQVRIIIECAENKSFVVQKSLITKHSDFFRACLGHDCQESRNSTIRLLDVNPDLMVLYLDLAHRQLQKRLRLGPEVVILSRDYPLVADWACLIELYQLIDFLQNVGLLKQVAYALRGCISFTPRQMCTVDAEDATIDRILEAFEMLEVNHRYQARFRDDIISDKYLILRLFGNALIQEPGTLEKFLSAIIRI